MPLAVVRPHSLARWLSSVLALAGAAAACFSDEPSATTGDSSSQSATDGSTSTAGGTGSSTAPDTTASDGTGTETVSDGSESMGGSDSGNPDEPPCDPAEQPIEAAIFVSPSGSDTNAGTPQFPVATIPVALAKAKAALAARIYLAIGDYALADTLAFTNAEAGIILEGGWQKNGTRWTPYCEPGRRSFTTLQVGQAIGVRVQDVTIAAGLWHLTLSTQAEGAADQSVFGLWASGEGTVFNLHDVEIVAGTAGDGSPAAGAPPATGTSMCDGTTGCCTVEPGCGDPAGPTPPAEASAGAPAGTSGVFDETGYVAQPGLTGSDGQVGIHGKAGGLGENTGLNCQDGNCGSCQGGNCQGGTPPTMTWPLVGGSGRCGCAGLGGTGGTGGRGGGASVALFVTQGATVSATFAVLRAGDGGDGAQGGPGGAGGPGAGGQTGVQGECTFGCYAGCSNLCYMYEYADGGSPGTPGGTGGEAGDGGGGSGGPSYAVVLVGGTFDDVESNELLFGSGGVGADGAAAGPSGVSP